MSTPLVSVCIPAYRGRWLDVAIASAIGQEFRDIEILVSDDSAGQDIAAIVAKWNDPRVRYLRNPHRGLIGTNRDHLIRNARGRYLKFLFDDDLLLPGSVGLLLAMIEHSGARMAFHARHIVDDDGCVRQSPRFLPEGTATELDGATFFRGLVGRCFNAIGEPSNILVDAQALRSLPFAYTVQERRMGFLSDVALYTNFMDRGLGLVGTGTIASAFRIHGSQTSGRAFAGYSAGLFEWELLRRWSVDRGHLGADDFEGGNATQMALYREHAAHYPELAPFLRIGGRVQGSRHMSAEFREALGLAYCTIALRGLADRAPAH